MTDTPEQGLLLNPVKVANSVTGYDEIAIQQRFGMTLQDAGQNGSMFVRVLYFVHLKHEGGLKDSDAHKSVMEMTIGELDEKFDKSGASTDDPDAIEDRDKEWADFVIGTGLSYTVDQFSAMTLQQRAKVIEAANRRG